MLTPLRILTRTLGVLLLVLLAAPTAWTLLSHDTYVTVTGHSMQPTYHVGDVLTVKRPTGSELTHTGQIVVVTFAPNALQQDAPKYVHRVHQPLPDGTAWLQGDNNPVRDPHPVTPAQLIGTPRFAFTGTNAAVFTALQTIPARISILVLALITLLTPIRRTATAENVTRTPEDTATDRDTTITGTADETSGATNEHAAAMNQHHDTAVTRTTATTTLTATQEPTR